MNVHRITRRGTTQLMRTLPTAAVLVATICFTIVVLAAIRSGRIRAFFRADRVTLGVEIDSESGTVTGTLKRDYPQPARH